MMCLSSTSFVFSGYMSGTEGQGGATPTMLQYLQLLEGGLLEAMFNTGNVKFGLGDHALVLRMVYL